MNCKFNVNLIPDKSEISPLPAGVCPVDWALKCVKIAGESNCGKSVFCRDGMIQLEAIITDICTGNGSAEDLALAEEIAKAAAKAKDCEIAAKAGENVLFSIENYRDEWEAHASRHRCKAMICYKKEGPKRIERRMEDDPRFKNLKEGEMMADVVVVAAGMSGLTAATQAAEKGAKVVVFEKGTTTGGAANMGMAFFAVGSKYQRDQMDTYTPDDAFRFFMEYTHWKADANTVRRWFNMSADTIEWVESFGVEFLGAYKYFQDSRATQHMVKIPGATKPAERQASRMVKLMTDYATEMGVDFHFNSPVKSIMQAEDGKIIGVVAVDETGKEIKCYADAVIVGTGGIGNNVKMIKDELGFEWGKDMFTFRIPGMDGDGMKMVWEVGGKKMPLSMEIIYNTPGVTDVFKTLSETMRQPSCIMVNPHGERIINEQIMNNTTYTGNAILQQTGHRAYSIIGSDGIDYFKEHGLDYITYHHNVKDLKNWENEKSAFFAGSEGDVSSSVFGAGNGVSYKDKDSADEQNFYELNSLEEVAAVIGCPYEKLKATIDEYNSYAGGYDAKFLKPSKWLRPITGDKFYVARHFPSGYGSLGGIKVNYNMECLDCADEPIKGLYACGTDAANVFAGEYCFYHPGSTMSWAMNSARIAAMEAVKYIESSEK